MNSAEEKILRALARKKLAGAMNAAGLSEASGTPLATLMSCIVGLEKDGFVRVERASREFAELNEEGAAYAAEGTPERRLRKTLSRAAPSEGMALDEAARISGISEVEKGIALQWLVREKLASVGKRVSDGQTILKPLAAAETPTEKAIALLKGARVDVATLPKAEFEILRKRKLCRVVEEKTAKIQITPEGLAALETGGHGAASEIGALTPQMLRDGSWKGKKFRPYDPQTAAAPLEAATFGKKHAYLELLRRVKEKLVGMGFREEHGPLVELEFWNMDALFMAQDHPAREIHDVFQVEDPSRGEILDDALRDRVRKAHESGLEGSKGWRYRWDPEVAVRLVLRSQTTAVSARTLARGIKPPLRMFSIGRVFRPEAIDWKHLMEFNQCEGIVCDESMNFRDLLGYLREFAVDIFGAEEVRFAPSYFPFTEPSVELYARMPERGWMEVGGAGMFRPEMLAALGVDVPVLAWGLGVDRLAMLKLGISDIRQLFSQDVDFLKQKW